jgi:hypothetical protein
VYVQVTTTSTTSSTTTSIPSLPSTSTSTTIQYYTLTIQSCQTTGSCDWWMGGATGGGSQCTYVSGGVGYPEVTELWVYNCVAGSSVTVGAPGTIPPTCTYDGTYVGTWNFQYWSPNGGNSNSYTFPITGNIDEIAYYTCGPVT